ncbi:histidinol-phosphatase [Methyloligella sp. GL2]|uniref:histidinol-phosphatase n=1 Tax=Methyloligella sp. GL2 TaxID=2742204 RepID=UPI001FF07735|nr:histidinol-phosphatase [Methyloligella sp. GL2]
MLPRFRAGIATTDKGESGFDPVTEADREAERVMRSLIGKRFPDHGIIGEEFGVENEDAPFCWILDPIDGTRAFIMGQPIWGTLIGLLQDDAPILGMMDQPFTGERFWSDGKEAIYQRGKTEQLMQTRSCASLEEALLGTTAPEMFSPEEAERFGVLADKVRLRRYGGDCYNYCLLALGQIDLVAESDLQPYDIVPLVPIIEAAGGVVTTWDGGSPRNGGRILAAGDPSLHEKALAILNP